MGRPVSGAPLTVLFLVVLIDMIGFTLVIPFLTYFIQDLATSGGLTDVGSRDRWVGIVLAAYTLGQFIFTPILGSLSDRHGRRPVLMIGLVRNTVFVVAFGLATSLWMALVARFLAGAGNGNIAVAKAYIGDISTKQELPSRMGMIGASFGLGFMIGPLLGGILTDPASTIGGQFDTEWWRDHPYFLPCLFAGALSFISLLLAFRLLPESLPKERRKEIPPGYTSVNTMIRNFTDLKDLTPSIRRLILTNAGFLFAFTMMHATFILFTAMAVENGGLGYDELMNGYIFAYVGLVGVIVQGGLIRTLSEKYDVGSLMAVGIVMTAIGLGSIPYLQPSPISIALIVMTMIAAGNGLFQPSQATLLTTESRIQGIDLGRVMGAQEGLGALSRIFGPILAAIIWAETVDGSGLWSYHTVFRVAGLVAILTLVLHLDVFRPRNNREAVPND